MERDPLQTDQPARPERRRLLITAAATTATLAFAGTGAWARVTPLVLSEMQWRARLSPAAFEVLRRADTERPFTSKLLGEHRPGVFACAGCDLPLFDARTKFDSGTGWPSFWAALPGAIVTRQDRAFLMVRTEEHCARCGGHQGHIFDDGPPPTGKRHCINGVALQFHPATKG